MAELRQARSFSIAKVRNLWAASKVALRDAKSPQEFVSAWRRFDAGYDSINCCGLLLLESNKLVMSGSGHHAEGMLYLVKTLRLKGDVVSVLPQLVTARNGFRYDGASNITEPVVAATIVYAARIQDETEMWLAANQPLALKAA